LGCGCPSGLGRRGSAYCGGNLASRCCERTCVLSRVGYGTGRGHQRLRLALSRPHARPRRIGSPGSAVSAAGGSTRTPTGWDVRVCRPMPTPTPRSKPSSKPKPSAGHPARRSLDRGASQPQRGGPWTEAPVSPSAEVLGPRRQSAPARRSLDRGANRCCDEWHGTFGGSERFLTAHPVPHMLLRIPPPIRSGAPGSAPHPPPTAGHCRVRRPIPPAGQP
jgi:hypothetical protein